jgi:hypothetical protein
MKKLLLAALLFSGSLQAQTKDTTISITLSLNEFRAVLATIDANVDSKRTSKELLDFLQKNARIINPVTDWNKKAQEATKQIDNKPKN